MDIYGLLEARDTKIEPSLDAIRKLCDKSGNPERSYPAIQVTGTNGKGSCSRVCSSALTYHGFKTGLYTSPHLISFSERISIDGGAISDEELEHHLRSLLVVIKEVEGEVGRALTGFEIMTAAAFKHFSEQEVDVAVLEAGMGGRWDATSVCDSKIGVITNVELDHQDYLGSTRVDIAREKSGVIPANGIALIGEQDHELFSVFEREAVEKKAEIRQLNRHIEFSLSDDRLSVKGLHDTYDCNFSHLPEYQTSNVALGLSAAEAFMSQALTKDFISDSFPRINFPGRMELIAGNRNYVLDGAHNPAAAKGLAAALKKKYSDRELVLVLAVLKDKNAGEIVEHLLPMASKTVLTNNKSPRCLDAHELEKYCQNYKGPIFCHNNFVRALGIAAKQASANSLIVITGSLYTVGLAKKLLNTGEQLSALCD